MIAEPPPSEPPPVARPAWLIALAVALALGLVVTVGYTGWAVAQRLTAVQVSITTTEPPGYPDEALAAATSCFESVFSYDYRSFDESVVAGLACATGDFRDEYRKTTRSLKATAIKEKAVVRAEVKQIGIVAATPRKVTVLAYIDQFRRNVNSDGEKLDQNRVTATVVLTGGEWRLVEAKAI